MARLIMQNKRFKFLSGSFIYLFVFTLVTLDGLLRFL